MCAGHCGFTLLELVVAIFILSIVLAVSLPSFSTLGEARITSDAKRLASILRYLNDSAITTKENLSFRVDLQNKTVKYLDPDGEKSERFDTISGVELQTKGMITEGEVMIPFGCSGAAESLIIHLTDDRKALAVAFNALSGRVKIKEE
jgi:prepilin-type N-terminal cleavage/methylation domain-containing protein